MKIQNLISGILFAAFAIAIVGGLAVSWVKERLAGLMDSHLLWPIAIALVLLVVVII